MLSFVVVAALIIGVVFVISRLRPHQAPGQTTHDAWNDPTSPSFTPTDSDTGHSHSHSHSHSHDSGGWGDMHGGGGSWDGDSSGGDSSSGSDD
ncbi:hypothetical protein K2Z83_01695 [Oscillochloris sp. ZM17-4]|uniref:hypothetical protein n=1 Tax=Oscillochloris sp. ZM17-4 TaxID=2866714 RepID=UPI001C735E40|nr:hypothetical protein [Oscillochloris sp. ZM17-4]MBX0326406.1 hypothetical protein [Oscillochloris sp. ZM17-4]